MFKKPFNKKVGELRICRICNEEWHTMKPLWRCHKCVNAKQKIVEQKKRDLYKKKDQYPFQTRTNQSSLRFSRIHGELSKAWKEYYKTGSRDALTKHYDKQLQEIRDNGILEWINDRRSTEAKKEMSARSRNVIRTEYPDTRGHYEY
jgi:hypothetical protein